MDLAYLVEVSTDLSETALTEAWEKAGKPEHYSVIVGTSCARYVRALRINGKKFHIWVNPDWKGEWMLRSQYCSVFSEGV